MRLRAAARLLPPPACLTSHSAAAAAAVGSAADLRQSGTHSPCAMHSVLAVRRRVAARARGRLVRVAAAAAWARARARFCADLQDGFSGHPSLDVLRAETAAEHSCVCVCINIHIQICTRSSFFVYACMCTYICMCNIYLHEQSEFLTKCGQVLALRGPGGPFVVR